MRQAHRASGPFDLSLACLLDVPDDGGSHPLVVMLHGFTGWKEEAHLESLAQQLAQRGIAALRFDAPGSGESDGTFADDYRLTNYLLSVANVLDFVSSLSVVDQDRLGIWGHSMGGFAALASAVRHRDRFRVVCGSQPSIGRSAVSGEFESDWRRSGWATFANDHFPKIELPYAFYLDRQQYNALEVVKDLDMPVLLIAGSEDLLVPESDVRSIYDAASDPKTFRSFPSGHDYKNDPVQLAAINNATVDFFTTCLLP